jgi:hypothetical protein
MKDTEPRLAKPYQKTPAFGCMAKANLLRVVLPGNDTLEEERI